MQAKSTIQIKIVTTNKELSQLTPIIYEETCDVMHTLFIPITLHRDLDSRLSIKSTLYLT